MIKLKAPRMNIRIVRKRNTNKEVFAELYGVSQDELPVKDEEIYLDGGRHRVLSVIKSYEADKLTKELYPDVVSPLDRMCWFEVDIT